MSILLDRIENQYFKKYKITKKGNTAMYIKTIFWLLLFIGSYTWYLQGLSGVELILNALFLAISIVGNGLNIMHDANHNALSSNKIVNTIMSEIMVVITGIINWLWKSKHNPHHDHTNIFSKDDDIGHTIVRLTPEVEYKPKYKYQHIYAWVLYCFVMFDWLFRTDILKGWKQAKKFSEQEKVQKRTHLIIHKLLYVSLYIIIPVFIGGYSWLTAIGIFVLINMLVGLITTVVFQLAHAVPITAMLEEATKRESFLLHQLKTTANFAVNNKVVSWLLGGLNFQVEHHLMRNISHVHYPKIAPIVREFCREYNLPYNNLGSVWAAIGSHYSQLKKLSRP